MTIDEYLKLCKEGCEIIRFGIYDRRKKLPIVIFEVLIKIKVLP